MGDGAPRRGSQRATVSLRLKQAELNAQVEVTSVGLLAIGAMVSAMLLSSAVIVRVAVAGKRARRELRTVGDQGRLPLPQERERAAP